MGKFNNKVKINNVVTYEGADAYAKDVVDDFVNNLFSNNLENSFYESSDERLIRFMGLLDNVRAYQGDNFVAKLAKFARNELGMRSVAQVVAASLNDSNMDGKRAFYRDFCHRPDDVAEILAFLDINADKPSHAMVRGFADYVSGLSEYQLGKYKMLGKNWNIYDIVNVTHAHSDAIDKLKNGLIEAPDTWEVSISGSSSEEEKAQNWVRLVSEHKLGYMALIMNLRNILASATNNGWVRDVLCPQIEDKDAIGRSLVFPYQIYNAYKNYNKRGTAKNLSVEMALSNAFMLACDNVPVFDGDTAVVIDVSGSMDSPYSKMSSLTILEISACYAAAFLIANPGNTDVYKFGTKARKFDFSPADDAFSLVEKLMKNDDCGFATVIGSVYDLFDKHYDRMLLFSDEQVMNGHSNFFWSYENHIEPKRLHRIYCKKYGRCPVYSFDLGNYPSQAVSDDTSIIRYFTTLSPQVFKFLEIVESGRSIADYIDAAY